MASTLYLILIVGEHVVEGLAQVVGTLFDLELLAVDLVLNVVNPLVQLGYVHLSVLEPVQGNNKLVYCFARLGVILF